MREVPRETPPRLEHTPRGLRSSAMRFADTKAVGLIPVGIGVAFVCFPTFGVAVGGSWLMWVFVAPFMLAGVALALVGLFLIVGRVRILTRPGRLGMRGFVGPIGYTLWVPAERIKDLRLRVTNDKDTSAGLSGSYRLEARIVPKSAGDKEQSAGERGPSTIAAGNDPGWLVEWAETIGRELDVPVVRQRAFERELKGEDDPIDTNIPPDGATYPEPPEGVPSWVETTQGGVTLYGLPDTQAKGYTNTLLAIGVLFPLIAGGVGAGFGYSLWGQKGGTLTLIGVGSVVALFVVGGLFALASAVRGKRSRWIVDITEGTLLLNARTAKGKVSAVLPATRITRVRIAHTGTSYGGTDHSAGMPVKEVRISPRFGKSLAILRGCSDDSLEWTAEVLRTALGLSAAAPGPSPDPADGPPEPERTDPDI